MADNTVLNLGAGGDTVASDDISGVKYPRSKIGYGADGSYTEVQATDPLPVVPGTYHTGRLTRASINAASSGDNSLVSATSSQTTKVYRMWFVNSGTANVKAKFRDGTTDLCAAFLLVPGGSFWADFSGEPYYTTSTNTAFNLNLDAAVQVSGNIWYIKN